MGVASKAFASRITKCGQFAVESKMHLEVFESTLAKALKEKRVLGAAVAATSGNGEFVKAYGHVSVQSDSLPMQPDSMMWVASFTKLMTAVSVMQCVERGLLDLDADISAILPEWKSPDIILGFDELSGATLTRKSTTPMTLRQLLTHSSGMGYDGINPLLRQHRKLRGGRDISYKPNSIAEDNARILTFEPGKGWEYGTGSDWAGKMVERVNGNQRLGDYMSQNIWKPLGMSSTTFDILKYPDLIKRLCEIPLRGPDGSLVRDTSEVVAVISPTDDSGGGGLYSCVSDYHKLLGSLLNDDATLLRPETVTELFRPQLEDTTHLERTISGPYGQFFAPGMPRGVKWNYALGGLVAIDGIDGEAGKGTMMWHGLPNLYWFIDRERAVCGIYASQLLPPGDFETAALYNAFQRDVYGSSL